MIGKSAKSQSGRSLFWCLCFALLRSPFTSSHSAIRRRLSLSRARRTYHSNLAQRCKSAEAQRSASTLLANRADRLDALRHWDTHEIIRMFPLLMFISVGRPHAIRSIRSTRRLLRSQTCALNLHIAIHPSFQRQRRRTCAN